ncbi:hypothetical protein AHiyo4_24530 [Arthrobacter sp. Hiyo4]|nr:hypothetical protein AHiyo4_24530 [Arthrobacter sp. Hiyo4]
MNQFALSCLSFGGKNLNTLGNIRFLSFLNLVAIFSTYLATYGLLGFVSVSRSTMDAVSPLRSLHSNMTDETRVLARLDGRWHGQSRRR